MLVRIMFGASRGDVWDMPPHEASAMLRDGRAVLPEVTTPAPAPTVEARSDRGVPRHQRKARR